MSFDSVLAVVYLSIGLIGGLVLHEFAHAFVALRLGDMTPKLHGRLTLNPKPHVDRFGTIVLPAILLLRVLFGQALFVFGYAKPQELNPWAFRRQDRNIVIIALAGPVTNVAVAFVLGAIFRVLGPGGGEIATFVADALLANVILAAMNLMPIPPLDMARVVAVALPPRAREVMTNLEQYGALFMVLIFFIFSGPIFSFVDAIANGICTVSAGGRCL